MTESAAEQYDLVIVGGGMVGAMLAAGLASTTLKIAVLEAATPDPFDASQAHDLRVSALSLASERMLRAVGAWESIVAMRCCPFRHMSVSDGEQGGKTEFFSGDVGETHLGHIVENRVLQLALHSRLESRENIQCYCPATLDSLQIQGDHVVLHLNDGVTLKATLVVGADGARSGVREQAGIETVQSHYPQHALVAGVRTAKPQQSTTWQKFVPTGPQAFLPLSGHRGSVVWYHQQDEIERLKALDERTFIAELETSFPPELGTIEAIDGRASFPLSRSHAKTYIKSRVALIGDAAHTVHPLAGQGVNLGLLDAAVLAEVIAKAHAAGQDIGELRRLRPYERWRRTENAIMINVLDGFFHAFKPQPLPVRHVRSLAMGVANRLSPLKHLITRYAVGNVGDLPELAKGRLPHPAQPSSRRQ